MPGKPTVYIETTIVSYLTSWPSRHIVRMSHELLTREWWNTAPDRFELCSSELVHQEAARGDPSAASERLKALIGIELLSINPEVYDLARHLATVLALPRRAEADAVHLAVTAVHGVSFLLTWNCRHLANATMADRIEETCEKHGYKSPRIVTPEQLMGLP
jgi:hypothetical protein